MIKQNTIEKIILAKFNELHSANKQKRNMTFRIQINTECILRRYAQYTENGKIFASH